MKLDNLLLKLKTLNNETKVFLVFAAFSALVLTTYGIYTFTNIFNPDNDQVVSTKEKEDIYKKIIENNPKSVLEEQAKEIKKTEVINNVLSDPFSGSNNSETSSQPNPATAETIYSRLEEVSRQLDEITNQPGIGSPAFVSDNSNPEYNYSYSKQTSVQGPKVCNVMQYGDGEGRGYYGSSQDNISEYYDYSEYNNKYFYKVKTTNTNLNLVSYNLYKNDRTQNNSIIFSDGDYAIRSNYPLQNFQPVSYPASYPSSYNVLGANTQNMSLQEAMEYYFGKGVRIDKVYEKDGKEYIQLSRTYSSICNWDPESVEYHQPKSDFIYVFTVNKANYSIENTKLYVSTISSSNLIKETTYTRETKKTTFAEVEKIFSYEYSKPIKDTYYYPTSYESSKEDRQQIIFDYIKNNNLDLLIPSREHYSLSYVFTDSPMCYTEWCNLYYNRAFYPMNDYGQSLYERNTDFLKSNPVFAKPMVSMYFKNKHHGYSHDIQVNLYSNSQSEAKIRNTQLYYSQFNSGLSITNGSVNLLINNQLNAGNYLETESRYDYVSYPASYPVSYPASYPTGYQCLMNSCFYKSGEVILNYRDSNYLVSYYGDRRDYLSDITYTTINITDPSDADLFRAMLQLTY